MQNKVVIITGASSGIGYELARLFASRGSKVVVAARRVDRLIAIVSEFGNENILAVQTDVTRESDCRLLIDKTVETFGRIDVLVNNAGISMRASFMASNITVLQKLMDVNFWGTIYCSKYALPFIVETKGSIVGIISVLSYYGAPGRAGYCAAKFAVRGFLDSLRVELRGKGINVLTVSPGFVASEVRISALLADGTPQGDSPRKEGKMMSATKCAKLIYSGIIKRKRNMVLSFVEGKIAVFLSKWVPSFVDYVNFKILKKEPDCPF